MTGFTRNRSSLAETAALLILCALFFILAAAAIATGVSAYNGSAKLIEDNNAYRTSLAYISNQVRRFDISGGVEIIKFAGGNALALNEYYDEGDGVITEYCTVIYCWGGWLRELYTEKELVFEFGPEAGIEVIQLDNVYFGATAGGQIVAMISHGAASGYVALTPRSDGPWEVVLP